MNPDPTGSTDPNESGSDRTWIHITALNMFMDTVTGIGRKYETEIIFVMLLLKNLDIRNLVSTSLFTNTDSLRPQWKRDQVPNYL